MTTPAHRNRGRRANPPRLRWLEPPLPTLNVWISDATDWNRLPRCGHRQVEHLAEADVALVSGEAQDITRADGCIVVALVPATPESSTLVVRALHAGADRCLVGPTSRELVALLDSLARRIGPTRKG